MYSRLNREDNIIYCAPGRHLNPIRILFVTPAIKHIKPHKNSIVVVH